VFALNVPGTEASFVFPVARGSIRPAFRAAGTGQPAETGPVGSPAACTPGASVRSASKPGSTTTIVSARELSSA